MFQMPTLTVDSIQNGKKEFINTYIKDPDLALAWNTYVDGQTKFCHSAMETVEVTLRHMGKQCMDTKFDKQFNPFSIDWYKSGWDAYVNQNTAQTKTAGKQTKQ
jgi:hypothetical protein